MSPGEENRRALRAALQREPRSGATLRALHRSYVDGRCRDEAWCVAATLVFLGAADAEQRRHFERGRLDGPIRPKAALTNELWLKLLTHPAQSLLVSKIFQQLWPAALAWMGKMDKDAGLARKYLVDPERTTVTLARSFGWAAQTLGIQPAPRLYIRQDVPGGISHLPVFPLGSLAGATLLVGFDPRALLFVVGRHLADYRGEHYVRTLLPHPEQLRTLLLAAMRIADRFPGDPRIDATAKQLLSKLSVDSVATVGTLCRLLVEAGKDIDLTAWLRAVELSACRAGLLCCNDLATAAAMVKALGRAGPVDPTVDAKIEDLVRFSVSEEYFQLRRALGIAIRVG